MVQMVQTKSQFYSLPNISVLSFLIFLNETDKTFLIAQPQGLPRVAAAVSCSGM